MWFRVFVKDRRYISGRSVRLKYFETFTEGYKWVKSLKNRFDNYYTVELPLNEKELQEFKK